MPNSKRLTPDASDDDRDSPRNPAANSNEVEEPNPPMAAGRRDENSISFRHFLQPHSDVVPTRHRNSRGPHSGAVDLVDVAMALPDFVQDHLVVESLASGDHQNASIQHQHHSSSLDLSVLNEILPDFTSSQRNHSCMSKGNIRRNHQDNSMTVSNGEGSHGQGVALPDFLSDGPMQCNNNDNNITSPLSTSRVGGAVGGMSCRNQNLSSENRTEDSHRSCNFDTDPLPQEVERLRRELTEKTRRMNQLEGEMSRTRSDANMLEAALRCAEQSALDANKRAADAERQVTKLNREIAFLTDQLGEKSSKKGSDNTSSSTPVAAFGSFNSVGNGTLSENSRSVDTNMVLNFARSSQILVSQLSNQIEELKLAATLPETEMTTEHSKANDSLKKSKQ